MSTWFRHSWLFAIKYSQPFTCFAHGWRVTLTCLWIQLTIIASPNAPDPHACDMSVCVAIGPTGSTLEAMAKAVEDSACVVVCVSKRYKESQACRTEAEYAFQQRKKIIPVLMEADYKPTGWLGALMGTRLYFNMSDVRQIPNKMGGLIKELGDAGK